MSQQLYHLRSKLTIDIVRTVTWSYCSTNISTVEGVRNESAHLVSWSSDSQGNQFFNTDENKFYLAVDADNNIVALPGDVSGEACTYCYY